jgi:hypothetical protein
LSAGTHSSSRFRCTMFWSAFSLRTVSMPCLVLS